MMAAETIQGNARLVNGLLAKLSLVVTEIYPIKQGKTDAGSIHGTIQRVQPAKLLHLVHASSGCAFHKPPQLMSFGAVAAGVP